MYSYLLLFILTKNILQIPIDYNYLHYNIVYIIYSVIIILLSTFDFDKIFKYLAFALTIISIGYMIIEYFNLKEIILNLFVARV
jgi:hypothetical protein